jgi:Fe-S-cluster containining protein
MTCEKCGKCCKIITLHPLTFRYDLEWLNLRNGYMIGGVAVFDVVCEWMGPDGFCKDYAHRPRLCRAFPFTKSNFLKELGCKYFEEGGDLNIYVNETIGAKGTLS